MKETTKTGMRKAESTLGVRYSVLLSLPYFDPVRFTVVDVMHNLFLGTGKYMFKIWLSMELLTKESLQEMERRISSFTVPNSLGRLPINISSNHGGYTSSQWQSWITLYSPVVLKGLLPNAHYQCWLLFVRACSILSRRIIKDSEVATADLLLLNFCKKFELLYGKDNCTPNLHMHLHIKDCLLDYGPSHALWCYSFERYNGMLGSYHTNRKSVESQIMRKFVNTQLLQSAKVLANSQLLLVLPSKHQPAATLASLSTNDETSLTMLPLNSISSFRNNGVVNLLPPFHEDIFSSDLLQNLQTMYTRLYPSFKIEDICPFFVRSGRVALCGELIGSVMNATCSNSSSVISAYWPASGCDLSSIDYGARMKVGTVQYFCKHQLHVSCADVDGTVGSITLSHTMTLLHFKSLCITFASS